MSLKILGKLEKMRIRAFSDEEFSSRLEEFQVLINPERYSQLYSVCYNKEQAAGSSGGSPKFNKIPSTTMSFELIFDGTGVVPAPLPGLPDQAPALPGGIDKVLPALRPPAVANLLGVDVEKQIELFKKIVFSYNGAVHRSNFLELLWGRLVFRCLLKELTITFTLFRPDGIPLRARANASFVSFESRKLLEKRARKSSPDLSHVLTVQAGDNLPLLCRAVYGDALLYPRVARFNDLTGFRDIPVGTRLLFPPIGELPA